MAELHVTTETATVYRAGTGRRFLTKDAAYQAMARALLWKEENAPADQDEGCHTPCDLAYEDKDAFAKRAAVIAKRLRTQDKALLQQGAPDG